MAASDSPCAALRPLASPPSKAAHTTAPRQLATSPGPPLSHAPAGCCPNVCRPPPPPPKPGDNTYIVGGESGFCVLTVSVQPCLPPVCNSLTVRLPQAISGSAGCAGAKVNESQLYSGAEVTLTPSLRPMLAPGEQRERRLIRGGISLQQQGSLLAGQVLLASQPPTRRAGHSSPTLAAANSAGRYTYTVSNDAGECFSELRVAPCNITCNSTTIQLPQDNGNCSAAVLQGSSMYNSNGFEVLIRPGGSIPNTFLPGA